MRITREDATPLHILLALGKLTMDEREAFVDSTILGLSHEDISKRMGVSRCTVANRIGSATQKLHRVFAVDR